MCCSTVYNSRQVLPFVHVSVFEYHLYILQFYVHITVLCSFHQHPHDPTYSCLVSALQLRHAVRITPATSTKTNTIAQVASRIYQCHLAKIKKKKKRKKVQWHQNHTLRIVGAALITFPISWKQGYGRCSRIDARQRGFSNLFSSNTHCLLVGPQTCRCRWRHAIWRIQRSKTIDIQLIFLKLYTRIWDIF